MENKSDDVEMRELQEVLSPRIELNMDIKQEDVLRTGNGRGQRKKYKTRSIAWDHVVRYENKKEAQCKYCPKRFSIDSALHGTGNMLRHFRYYCAKAPDFLKRIDPKQKVISSYTGMSSLAYSSDACRLALAEMIIIDELPFRFVQGEGFNKFCKAMQHKFQIPARVTITRDCMKLFRAEKEKVRAAIIGQRLSLTTDTWTSIQNLNYMCLTAHYIDADWNYVKKILNFSLVDSHKGEMLGKAIETCLLDWGIESVFTVTVDNAGSNNGAIAHLKKKTSTWKDTVLAHEFLHMRCCAHILNLVVSDGLKEACDSIEKVRNAIRYVRSSPSRLATFKKCAEKQKIDCKSGVCLDVPTRWNSTYLMLESAVKHRHAFERLEEDDVAYKLYFHEEDKNLDGVLVVDPGKKKTRKILGPPECNDFSKAIVLLKFLKLFYDATCKFSGSLFVTSNTCYVELALIQRNINSHVLSDDSLLSMMARGMKLKFDKYWGNIHKTNLLLYVAVVLDPRRKMNYIEFCFGKLMDKDNASNMIKEVRNALSRLFEWFASKGTEDSKKTCNLQQAIEYIIEDPEEITDSDAFDHEFKLTLIAKTNSGSNSELEQYLLDTCIASDSKFEILDWWKLNCGKYPTVSQLARAVLAVPVSTVASESCFSSGGRILDPFRSSLSPRTVESLICTQNWLKSSTKNINMRQEMDCVTAYERAFSEENSNQDNTSVE